MWIRVSNIFLLGTKSNFFKVRIKVNIKFLNYTILKRNIFILESIKISSYKSSSNYLRILNTIKKYYVDSSEHA